MSPGRKSEPFGPLRPVLAFSNVKILERVFLCAKSIVPLVNGAMQELFDKVLKL
jgi:hypothetical protein